MKKIILFAIIPTLLLGFVAFYKYGSFTMEGSSTNNQVEQTNNINATCKSSG